MELKCIEPKEEQCTACMACQNACPRDAINVQINKAGDQYPAVDHSKCIQCGLCTKVCHLDKDFFAPRRSELVFAAWNTDKEIRRTSASGGIASALYQYALDQGIHAFGVLYDRNKSAHYVEIKNKNDIDACRNSKYIVSNMNSVYSTVRDYINNGEKVFFIGLPCHSAALLAFLGKRCEQLTIVDIVCHGTCSEQYLEEHVKYIEKKKRTLINDICFRDPEFGTNRFYLSMKNGKRTVYHAPVEWNDAYQIGYHKALIYRENCYQCRYARPERVSDITISDFSGLGRIEPWEMNRKSISCVIVSTEKGRNLLECLEEEKRIKKYERNPQEAFGYEHQLIGPSTPNPKRKLFLDLYSQGVGFDRAVLDACKKETTIFMVNHCLHTKEIKNLAKKLVPKRFKESLRRYFKSDS